MQNIEPPGLDIGGTCVELPGNGGEDLWAARESAMTGWRLWSPVCVRGACLAGETEYRAPWAPYRWDVRGTARERWWGPVGCERERVDGLGALEPSKREGGLFSRRNQISSPGGSIPVGPEENPHHSVQIYEFNTDNTVTLYRLRRPSGCPADYTQLTSQSSRRNSIQCVESSYMCFRSRILDWRMYPTAGKMQRGVGMI
jgi:hypothetical protein